MKDLVGRVHTTCGQESLQVGSSIGQALASGCVVYLLGKLGAGKTTLSGGILQGLGHFGVVKSPTYSLVEPYQLANETLFHFDLYRLGSAGELEGFGGRDYFDSGAICLIEWPERGAGVIPAPDLVIQLEQGDKTSDHRIITVASASSIGRVICDALKEAGQLDWEWSFRG